MFVSGFTIARNVIQADYPIKEAVYSILSLCNEVVIAVGKSEDDTLNYIKSWNEPKIKIIETIWDDNLRKNGAVLAVETNKAMAATNPKANWLFYIQADEVIHENYLQNIKLAMEQNLNINKVEGLYFNYTHFYGSYNYIGDSRRWYRSEVRIIKANKSIISWGDAMGFKSQNHSKLKVKPANATVYHYGWVKHPQAQLQKQKQFHILWHSDSKVKQMLGNANQFDYSEVDSLKLFNQTHPIYMKDRIQKMDWSFNHNIKNKNFTFKTKLLYLIEKLTGWRVGEYQNFIKLK